MDGAVRDRNYERREKMIGAVIVALSGAITVGLIGGAVVVALHFVVKFW